MATVALLGSVTWNTTGGNTTVTTTPTGGDLIIVIAGTSGLAGGTTAVSDDKGGTYVQVDSDRTGFSTTGVLTVWARTAPIENAVSTIFTASQATSTGGGLGVLAVRGVAKYGANAVRSAGGQSTGTAGTAPAPVLSLTPKSTNAIISAGGAGTNGADFVPRTGYTELHDAGFNTPATTLGISALNSGETSATITYAGTTATAFASVAIEIDSDTPTFLSPGIRPGALKPLARKIPLVRKEALVKPRFESVEFAASIAGIGELLLEAALSINGDFETNSTGWSAGANATVARSLEQAHAGTASLKVVTNGVGTDEGSFLSPTATAVPGRVYRSTQWVYAGTAGQTFYGGLVWYLDAAYVSATFVSFTSVVGWQRVEVQGVAPVGVNLVTVFGIRTAITPQATTTYLDEVTLVQLGVLLYITRAISVAIAGIGSVALNFVRDKRVVSTSIAGIGTVVTEFGKLRLIAAVISGTGTVVGNFVRDKRVLAASIAGTGTVVANIVRTTRGLSTSIAGTGAVVANFIRDKRVFASSVAGTGAVVANFIRVKQFAVSIAGTGAVVANFVRTRTFAVVVSGIGTVAADLVASGAGAVVKRFRTLMGIGE